MKLTVNTEKQLADCSDLFGIFFEDLNHAADGGLYAELVQNRSFEFCPIDNPDYHGLTAWETIEYDGKIHAYVEEDHGAFPKNPHYLVLEVREPGVDTGIWNLGFNTGLPLKKEERYEFTCYARRREAGSDSIRVSLRSCKGTVYEEQCIVLTDEWEKYTLEFSSDVEDTRSRLAIVVDGSGAVEIDFVSLFPEHTYKNRKNGMRKDLAELLEAMHPKFMRFPGGCLTHDGSLNPDARNSQYRWKNSIGPVENRPARRNNWGYNQTLGLGYYEYFLLSEDFNAKPLPVLPGGYNPHAHEAADGNQLESFIQDALDLIQFANGDTNTVWGAKRAKLGHPDPFHLEYLAIGNEEIGEEFFERYPLFHKAVKEKYPKIRLIGTSGPFAAGTEYDRGWISAKKEHVDLVDEHFYQSPDWFLTHSNRYQEFLETDPKVFLGEYATQDNTWYNCLAEAAFMVEMQNAAKAVGLACYAPLFCNVDYQNWFPDMIYFNNHKVQPSANYEIQKLFMLQQGDIVLSQELTGAEKLIISRFPDTLPGKIVFGADDAEVEYTDTWIVNDDTGEKFTFAPFTLSFNDQKKNLMELSCRNYTIHTRAKELSGKKGFVLSFGEQDEKNRVFWRIGGWANEDSMICEDVEGRNSVLTQTVRSVEQGRCYDLTIRVEGRKVITYVDGNREIETTVLPVKISSVYTTASMEKESGDVIIKFVNVLSKEQKISIELIPNKKEYKAVRYEIQCQDKSAQNLLGETARIVPEEREVLYQKNIFEETLLPQSVTVIRLGK